MKIENHTYILLFLIVSYFRYKPEINELFEFLKTQDSSTAAAAYNAMICGLAKHSRVY